MIIQAQEGQETAKGVLKKIRNKIQNVWENSKGERDKECKRERERQGKYRVRGVLRGEDRDKGIDIKSNAFKVFMEALEKEMVSEKLGVGGEKG